MRLFNFAWVDAVETTFGPEHEVEDLEVVSFTIDHKEGDIPTLSVDVKNPRIGLLNPGRKTRLWLSENIDGTAGANPLFFGRLVGIPTNMLAEKVTLLFIAKPDDYEEQKAAVAESLRVLPFYDPLFVDEAYRNDADAVLEGYSRLWHVDRVTGEVTTSDYIAGEAGIEEFEESEVPYASVSITLDQAPLTSVSVEATVYWTQSYLGQIDFGAQTIESYTGDGILSDWPKPGAALGGGYTVASSSALDTFGVQNAIAVSWSSSWQNKSKEHTTGDTLSVNVSVSGPIGSKLGDGGDFVITDRQQIGLLDPFADPPINIAPWRQMTFLTVPLWQIQTSLVLDYEAARKRSERIKFTLTSDLQPVLTDPDVADTAEIVTLNGGDVAMAIPDDSTAGSYIPIVDPARRSYFPTARGLLSLEYMISVARARLLWRSRVVRVSFDCSFARAVDLSCRKNARLRDRRLPGGEALGKIVAYAIKCESAGSAKKLSGSVTMACAVGFGIAVETVAGTPAYVVEGYVDPAYQVYSGSTVLVSGTDNVGYGPPVESPDDDGLVFPLSRHDVVVSESVTGSLSAQAAAITVAVEAIRTAAQINTIPAYNEQISIEQQQASALAGVHSVSNELKANPISYNLELIPVAGGSFETEYFPAMTKLTVPKQIDLQAAAV